MIIIININDILVALEEFNPKQQFEITDGTVSVKGTFPKNLFFTDVLLKRGIFLVISF